MTDKAKNNILNFFINEELSRKYNDFISSTITTDIMSSQTATDDSRWSTHLTIDMLNGLHEKIKAIEVPKLPEGIIINKLDLLKMAKQIIENYNDKPDLLNPNKAAAYPKLQSAVKELEENYIGNISDPFFVDMILTYMTNVTGIKFNVDKHSNIATGTMITLGGTS